MVCRAHTSYSQQDLLLLGSKRAGTVTTDFLHHYNIPVDIARPPGSPLFTIPGMKRKRWRQDRKQKQGCRASAWERLRKTPHKTLLTSLFLTNARSVVNKMDELKLQLVDNRLIRECCALIITELWLHPAIPDAAVELEGCVLHHYNRNLNFQKKLGGGLCIYIMEQWANNTKAVDNHCSPDC